MFLDRAKILLRSGNGGSGAVSFRREKYVPRGGPDGGDGGRGGNIFFIVRNDLSTLSEFQYKHHFQAENGEPGGAANRSGKDGADLYIPVPPGTVIRDSVEHRILADLTEIGTTFLILKGGRGGRGNARFASSTRQSPRFAEKGELGSELWVELELKLLADVGLIGFPNAGKSTLLSRISAARPKVADYPFTTLIPNLGVVNVKGQSFVAVDIPGLIEGAHRGAGLGDQFLRHIERTRLLVHLVDVSGVSGRDPYRDYLQINEELRLFNPELATRIQIVAANKIDLPESKAILETFMARMGNCPVIPISAATGEGVSDLLDRVLYQLARIPKEPSRLIAAQPEMATESLDIQVQKTENGFMVQNDGLLRRMARFDLNNEESLRSLQRLLKRWGVIQALIDAGVREGDTVRIGDFEFTYLSEE